MAVEMLLDIGVYLGCRRVGILEAVVRRSQGVIPTHPLTTPTVQYQLNQSMFW